MNDKQLVAQHAARLVEDGMTVGLGTGSTADYFIAELAHRQSVENLQINCIASSVVSTIKAQTLGLPLIAIEHLSHLDLYVDGADEVSPDNTLLKGRGADLVKEKLLATNSDQFIVLIDPSKRVQRIGENFPIPIEVMPCAWQLVLQKLIKQGGSGELRKNTEGNGLIVTAYGSLVLDIHFDSDINSAELDALLNATPGVIEHGIFHQLASTILLAEQGEVNAIKAS